MAALSDITERSGVHLPDWEYPNKPPDVPTGGIPDFEADEEPRQARYDPGADAKAKSGQPTDTERYPDNFEGPLPGPNQGGGRAKGGQSNSETSGPPNLDMTTVLVGLGLVLGAAWVL